MSVSLVTGCGGAVSTTQLDQHDAGERFDAEMDRFVEDSAQPNGDASAVDEDSSRRDDVDAMVDVGLGPDDGLVDGRAGCECENLDTCCHQAAQVDNGTACRADVSRGDEGACRTAVLRGKYGCLALGFVPRCSTPDDALCPTSATRCTGCLTAIRGCGPVIQCVADPACKPAWDSVVACDQAGRPFFDCFQLLSSKGNVPGELVLLGAQCVDTCQNDR